MKYFLLFLLSVACIPVSGQGTVIERTREKVYASRTDEERIINLVALCKLRNSLPGDSIHFYSNWVERLAIKLKDNRSLAWAEYSYISGDLANGKTDSVIYKIDNSKLFRNIKKTDPSLYYKVWLLKANALNRQNDRTAALDLELRLLNEAEKEGDLNARLFIMNFIGATYLNVNRLEDARSIWTQALQLTRENRNPENDEIEAYISSNLALYHFDKYNLTGSLPQRDSFLTTINYTIELARRNENLSALASSLNIRGSYYGGAGQFALGEQDLKEGLNIRKKIGDPLYIMNDLMSLGSFYYSQKQFKLCIATAREGIALADSNHIKGEQIRLMLLIAYAYKAMGDFKEYSVALEQYMLANDAAGKANSAEKIAEIRTKYDVQKKETLIAQQKLELFQRNLFLFTAGFAVLGLLIFLLFRFRRYQHLEKIKLAKRLEEEKKANELAIKEAGENERKRIAAELHDNLGVQANAILYNSSLLNLNDPASNDVVTDLQETAKEMLVNLRETLWAMKTSDVSATDLWMRIVNFMKQMGRHYTFIHFKVEGTAPEQLIIPSNKALNMVLVLQEAVNNAVKHSGATTIKAVSTLDDPQWNISIQDEGAGFSMAEAENKTDSYGLQNMKERAAAGDFTIRMTSAPGCGATVRIGIAIRK